MHPPKYPSTPHWPWSQQVHKDDRYHASADAFIGEEVVITEKLDGGNTCLSAGEVYARSTGQPAVQGWFAMVKKYHAWKTMNSPASLALYGEDLAARHSLDYTLPRDETYKVFAARDGDDFLSWDDTVALATGLGFQMVPVLFRGTFRSTGEITAWMNRELKQPSAFGPEREGFVMRMARGISARDFALDTAKFVRSGHVQTTEHWTRNWTWNELIA